MRWGFTSHSVKILHDMKLDTEYELIIRLNLRLFFEGKYEKFPYFDHSGTAKNNNFLPTKEIAAHKFYHLHHEIYAYMKESEY